MMASAHMHFHGSTRQQLAEVAVKNHANGFSNPKAQYQMKVTAEQVLSSPAVADPLRLLDCSPITDGAAAVILMPVDKAKEMGIDPIVRVAASAHATDPIALAERSDLTRLESTARAASAAYEQAGIGPTDLSFCEVHDCFTIAEVMVTEALGLVEVGKGGEAAASGVTALDGRIPINPSGGLKSKGHPVGATGVAQIAEVVDQFRGACGDRQIKNPQRALTQNMGGTGASTVVHVFDRA
jgi:acetyl-CoA C-acetyltransferase